MLTLCILLFKRLKIGSCGPDCDPEQLLCSVDGLDETLIAGGLEGTNNLW